MDYENLVQLDADHPGFRDAQYRARRDLIASVAHDYRRGDEVPQVEYTAAEHQLWRQIDAELADRHRDWACREILEARARLALPSDRIPQLAEVNLSLAQTGGFRMEPVAGLIDGTVFLRALAGGVFLSTQYIRHTSRPCYTPEPDVVHELQGHAATLADARFAQLSRAFGEAAATAPSGRHREIERLYWYTLEYGCVMESGRPKAVGAGLLSSVDEITHVGGGVEIRPFRAAVAAGTDYDPTNFQPVLFMATSFEDLLAECHDWLSRVTI
ncbi:MAG TPA: phenylalanine 4-monooxygenase [Candidatus Krumholzibacteria bacterium]|jgi:phenylalanine-4-hydroxylase